MFSCVKLLEEWILDDSVLEKVIRLLAQCSHTNTTIQPSSQIISDLGLDSLAIIELAVALETEFGIEISDSEVADSTNFGSVERIALFVEKKMKILKQSRSG